MAVSFSMQVVTMIPAMQRLTPQGLAKYWLNIGWIWLSLEHGAMQDGTTICPRTERSLAKSFCVGTVVAHTMTSQVQSALWNFAKKLLWPANKIQSRHQDITRFSKGAVASRWALLCSTAVRFGRVPSTPNAPSELRAVYRKGMIEIYWNGWSVTYEE